MRNKCDENRKKRLIFYFINRVFEDCETVESKFHFSGFNTHLSTARTSSQKLEFISVDDATGEYRARNSPNSIQSIRFTYAYFDQSQAKRVESFE